MLTAAIRIDLDREAYDLADDPIDFICTQLRKSGGELPTNFDKLEISMNVSGLRAADKQRILWYMP